MLRSIALGLVLLCPVVAAAAGERVSGTNFFVVKQQSWPTGEDSGYFIWQAEGIQHAIEGPLDTEPIECHGAGFWNKNGPNAEGICIIGAGDHTRTSQWRRVAGEKTGEWETLSATGKYAGMSGRGSYMPQPLQNGRYMSHWEGEVTLAK